MSDSHVSLTESLRITAKAENEYDTCPECGEDYIDLDTTLTGNLVFIHDENPLVDCRVEPETEEGANTDE